MTTPLAGIDPRSALRLCQRSAEFRAAEGVTDGRTLEGYAAVFDQPTIIGSYAGDFEEVVKRGAFRKTLRERKPVMQFDHGNDKRTGTIPIAAIEDLYEDDEGLFVRARLFDTERVEDIRQAVAAQAIRGMSFKFEVLRDRWVDAAGVEVKSDELAKLLDDPGDRGPIRREIQEVKLYELGPVVYPAYEQTSVGVRSAPAGSPFRPAQVALRGVVGQFGLDVRCIRRHLQVFDDEARRALAAEIADTFPELVEVLAQRAAPVDQPPAEGGAETSAEPAPATRQRKDTEPVARHSVHTLRETADWYLPPRN